MGRCVMMPKISLIIPTYNRKTYLGAALESCLAQTEIIDEIIVVDNNSSDYSFEVAKSYSQKDGAIKVFRNDKNIGMVKNWNRGIEYATNDYVSILHSDDILPKDWCEIVKSKIRKSENNGVGIYFGISVKVKIDDDMRILSRLNPFRTDRLFKPGESLRELWRRFFFNCNNSAAIVYKKSILMEFGGFDSLKNIEADQDLHIRILNKYPAYYINNDLVYYRIHEFQSFDTKIKQKTCSDTANIVIRSIGIQKSLLERSLLKYYYCYVVLLVVKLFLLGEFLNVKRILRSADIFRFQVLMNIPRFIFSEYVTRRYL